MERKNRALFLDRDGTIIVETNYLSSVRDLRLIRGTARALNRDRRAGFKIVIISNQAGVAKGYFTEREVMTVNKELLKRLKRGGVTVDGVYYCPHHPEGVNPAYTRKCECRKPGIELLKRAARSLNLDLGKSYLIGDRSSDIEAGKNAGCHTVLVRTGYGNAELKKMQECREVLPDSTAGNIGEAVEIILTREKRPAE